MYSHQKAILFLVVGFLLGTLLFRCILWPDRIATLKNGTQPVATIDGVIITADDLSLDSKDRRAELENKGYSFVTTIYGKNVDVIKQIIRIEINTLFFNKNTFRLGEKLPSFCVADHHSA